MAIIKEYKQFFLRNIQVNSGANPDQESGYPTQYIITGKGSVYNRLLQGHYPSEGVFRKLIESLPFKLNVEDTASTTEQGLVRVATDVEGIARLSSGAGVFTNVVKPHQLPDVVLTADGNDTIIGAVEEGGLKLSTLTRVIGALSWRNFKVEVNRDKSIVIDGTTKKVQLDGDSATPGNKYYYGTNASGVKGFFAIPISSVYNLFLNFVSLTGVSNGSGIGTYVLDTKVIPANKIDLAGDEIEYEIYAQYFQNDLVTLGLYNNGVLVKNIPIQDVNDANVKIKYKLIYVSTTNAILISEITQSSTVSNDTNIFIDNPITLDVTIVNTLELKALTSALGAGQFNLLRSTIKIGKQ